MALTIGDFTSRLAQQLTGSSDSKAAPRKDQRNTAEKALDAGAQYFRDGGQLGLVGRGIASVGRGMDDSGQPWARQLGDAVEGIGEGTQWAGRGLNGIFGTSDALESASDFAGGDGTMGDAANIGLFALNALPGAGQVGRLAGRGALKAGTKAAGEKALKAEGKKQAALSPGRLGLDAAAKSVKSGTKAGDRGKLNKLFFDDASLGRSGKAVAAKASAKAPNVAQRAAAKGVGKGLAAQRRLAPERLTRTQNAMLGRNKSLLNPLTTRRHGYALRGLANAMVTNNGLFGLGDGGAETYGPEGPAGPATPQAAGPGYYLYPGGGYGVGGGGVGGGPAPALGDQLAALLRAGNLQSNGDWVNLS